MIDAPANRVFDVLAAPLRHSEFDGSGTVRGIVEGPDRLDKGAEFGMRMRLGGVRYRITNRVVEFEENRLLAWRHIGAHRWRWEFADLADGTTQVRETFDYSLVDPVSRLYYVLSGFPTRNARGIEATLSRLKALVEAD